MEVFHTIVFLGIDKEKGMKKILVLALLLIVMAGGVFALDKTFGGGVLFNYSKTSGSIDYYYGSYDWNASRTGFGAFAFFGISKFIEFNLGLLYKNPGTWTVEGTSISGDEMDLGATAALQLGIYGKYPFVLSDRLVLFPTVGVDFEYTFDINDEGWWSDLWFRGGAGVDFFLSDRLFLRGHLIYGVAIPMLGDEDIGYKLTHGFLGKLGIGFMF